VGIVKLPIKKIASDAEEGIRKGVHSIHWLCVKKPTLRTSCFRSSMNGCPSRRRARRKPQESCALLPRVARHHLWPWLTTCPLESGERYKFNHLGALSLTQQLSFLSFRVVAGRDLKPLDDKQLSDPFCKVSVPGLRLKNDTTKTAEQVVITLSLSLSLSRTFSHSHIDCGSWMGRTILLWCGYSECRGRCSQDRGIQQCLQERPCVSWSCPFPVRQCAEESLHRQLVWRHGPRWLGMPSHLKYI